MNKLPYDNSNLEDIIEYSKKLIHLRFSEILERNLEGDRLKESVSKYNSLNRKGGLGNLIEEYFYLYKPNSDSSPDFKDVGLEIKVVPYDRKKKGIRAGERLVITMIPNDRPIEKEFKNSHLEKKMRLMLMIWYHRQKNIPKTEFIIDYVNLYNLYSEILRKDLPIILDDYKIIVDKIISGNAHKLSEADTRYLGACTKGANAKKSLQPQYYNSKIPAKKRAFSLKQSYMNYILNNYVCKGLMNCDSIFKNKELESGNFDVQVLNKINKFIGLSEKELYSKFLFNLKSKPKHINKILINKILGINTDNSEEFEKAGIVIKTIRTRKNGMPREDMSFSKIIIKKFVEQKFESSREYEFFEKTRFLFVVFKENENKEYIFKGAKFWNMPITELETTGRKEWLLYKNKFEKGVNFFINENNGKTIIENDLPKKTETEIFHVRLHSRNSAYIINGKKYGKGKESDMDELPDGNKMTHQCFWLNKQYIANIIKDMK